MRRISKRGNIISCNEVYQLLYSTKRKSFIDRHGSFSIVLHTILQSKASCEIIFRTLYRPPSDQPVESGRSHLQCRLKNVWLVTFQLFRLGKPSNKSTIFQFICIDTGLVDLGERGTWLFRTNFRFLNTDQSEIWVSLRTLSPWRPNRTSAKIIRLSAYSTTIQMTPLF